MSLSQSNDQKHPRNDSLQKFLRKKGFLSDNGVWMCDCQPRMPARRLQTIKEGQNFGRWFYTCKRPKATGCDLFIWENEAKVREREFAFRNHLFKPIISTPTPVKDFKSLITPPNTIKKDSSTNYDYQFLASSTPSKSLKITKSIDLDIKTTRKGHDDDESTYDWSSEADEELCRILPDDIMTPDSLPRKVMKVDRLSTPSKRHIKIESDLLQQEDVPTRPTTITPIIPSPFLNDNLPLLEEIPTSRRSGDSSGQQSSLAIQPLHVFEDNQIPLSSEAKEEALKIASKHDKCMQSRKGRDISRAAITKKSGEIVRLQERIIQLEADRQLLQELAKSQDDGL